MARTGRGFWHPGPPGGWQGWTWKRPEECASPGAAGGGRLRARPYRRGRVDEHRQESSDRHVQRDREVPVGEVDPPALPYRAAEDRPQPRFRLWAGQGLGRLWYRWLPKDCAHSSPLPSVGCRAARATSTSSGKERPRGEADGPFPGALPRLGHGDRRAVAAGGDREGSRGARRIRV